MTGEMTKGVTEAVRGRAVTETVTRNVTDELKETGGSEAVWWVMPGGRSRVQ